MGNGVVSVEPNLRSRGVAATAPPTSSSGAPLSRYDELCRAIVEGSEDAIVSHALDGIVTSWNPGAERIFGHAAARMIGQSIKSLIPAELLAEDHFVLLEIEQGHRIPPFDTVRVARDGRRIPVSLAVSPIHDSHGVVIGASLVARDIGERKRGEAAAKAANRAALEPRREAERANPAKTEFLSSVSEEIRGGDARILVVDDLEATREIVEAYLDGRGYRVESVGAALDAIQMLGAETFDLVLMDIQMPVMDGMTATKRIRALPKPMSDVPILAMTGNVLPMQIKSFLDAGMNGHIAKPISRAKLHESVRRWGWRRSSPAAEPAPSASADEDRTIDELVAVVGVERARKIANDFSSQLNAAFRLDCTLAEARRQAHDLINCAGFLGLGRFVGACQILECHPAGDATSENSALARIRAERDLARDILSGQLLPRLRDQAFRPTG